MEKTIIDLPSIQLIGITTRTNNQAESSWDTGKIWPCVRQYFHEQRALKIPHRKKPGTTLCAYTAYDQAYINDDSCDYQGDYTYFIGEEVTSLESCPEGFDSLLIPPQTYVKFTNGPAPMPDVVRKPWLKIWAMTPQELGGIRRFATDFEVYDERAADHEHVVLDILIGIKDSLKV